MAVTTLHSLAEAEGRRIFRGGCMRCRRHSGVTVVGSQKETAQGYSAAHLPAAF